MQDRPTAAELLETIAELLERDVLPVVRGPLQHQVRVAGNLCRVLERESRLGPETARRELELLRELTGSEPAGSPADEIASLNTRLAELIEAGAGPDFERRAWAALVEIVRGKLSIDKPGHDSWDFATELD